MKRIVIRVILVVLIASVAFGVWARLFAGGPVGPIPGGWIRGEIVDGPVDDWTFAKESQYLLVESRARMLPYSSQCWFMVKGGRIFLMLPALFGDSLERRIEEDPRIRIGIDGRVYNQRAVAMSSDGLVGELMGPILRRIGSIELEGDVRRVPGASKLEGANIAIYVLENTTGDSDG